MSPDVPSSSKEYEQARLDDPNLIRSKGDLRAQGARAENLGNENFHFVTQIPLQIQIFSITGASRKLLPRFGLLSNVSQQSR